MITQNDIQGLIALAILSDRQAFASVIGFPATSTNEDLLEAGMQIYSKQGFNGIKNLLLKVPLDKSKLSTAQQNALIKKFALQVNTTSKCDWAHPLECLTGAVNYVGDLLGGHSSTTSTPVTQQQTSESALSPWVIGLTVVAGIAMIGIFRKFTAVVVGVIIIVMAVVIYGVFAKKTTTTVSGGGSTTTSSGGIGSVFLGWLSGLGGGG